MPSPFPGMDPYLEGSLWMSVHTQLAVEIARQLAPRLRPRYLALTMKSPIPARNPIPHVTVEIRDTAHRQLVTAIEVLSPTNKRGDGRQEYLVKRQRILTSDAHLLEIDLLREGRRLPTLEPLPDMDYGVFLSRAEQRPAVGVWPIRLRSPLPQIPVPLLPGDADVLLDLQLAFTQVYDLIGYDLAVDYSGPPEVPLAPEDAAWAAQLLENRRVGAGSS